MIDLGRVRFVYFDLDDTLLDHRYAEGLGLRDLHASEPTLAVVSFDEFLPLYRAANSRVWPKFAAGEINKQQAKALRFKWTLESLGSTSDDSARLGDRYLELYADHWRFVEGAEVALRRVADHFPVGLLTNGFSEIQRKKLDRFPILKERCDPIVISDELGVMKPFPEIFERASVSAGHPAEGILYVGDSWRSDIEGALGAAWQAAWFSAETRSEAVFSFDAWPALLSALEID